ncbi:hypothetical protein DYB32_010652 [Aphanomyces invadans]|nr:hypothetical protein DYB32_010652 [Aphanomyces invadans]
MCLGLTSVFFVGFDVIMNNWELINYLGNSNYLLTPLINLAEPSELSRTFAFPDLANVESMSEGGMFLIHYIMDSCYIRDPTDYVLTAGAHYIDSAANGICGTLVQSYPLPPNTTSTTMNLGVVYNYMQLVRGNTLDNYFTAPDEPPPPNASYRDLAYLGFIPARVDVDMRLTTPVEIPPVGETIVANVSMYRFNAVAFCSGCDPVIELGLDVCKSSYYVDPATHSLVVTSSHAYQGEYHMLGAILERSSGTQSSLYLRGIALVLALVSFATSKKTTRWTETGTVDTAWKRVVHTLAPPLYRYSSHTFTFANFCLNSDWFVLVYVVAVLLDEKNSMTYSRLVYHWNIEGDNRWIDIQMAAIQFRWLWINCFIVKATKVVVNFVSMSRYNGSNSVVGFFNFSSVLYIYFAAIFLMQRTEYIEYGNSDMATLSSTNADLDSIRVDFFSSWFIRSYPSMMLVMLVNLFVMLSADRLLNWNKWRRLSQNSLARQAMYNSSSILCEMCYSFHDLADYKNQAVIVQARALCTFQWFLMCHTLCFGLPENPKHVRAMLTKSVAMITVNGESNSTLSPISECGGSVGDPRKDGHGNGDNKPSSLTLRRSNKSTTTELKDDDDEDSLGAVKPITSDSKDSNSDLCIVAQDVDGVIHLYDSRKREIQSMTFEVKILSNSRFVIA